MDDESKKIELRQRFITQLLEAPWTQILVTLVVVLAMVFIAKVLVQDPSSMNLSETTHARGFITVLFGVGTIAIAVIVTLSGVFLTGEGAKERFDRGKEVLSLILGIFGTIVGFYYGSASTEKGGGIGTASASQQSESTLDSKVTKPKVEASADIKKTQVTKDGATDAVLAPTKPSNQ